MRKIPGEPGFVPVGPEMRNCCPLTGMVTPIQTGKELFPMDLQ